MRSFTCGHCELAHTDAAMTIRDHEIVELNTATGPMRTFLFRPQAEGRYPGILLHSEIFQVTAPIRRTAALLAGHGYVVAVPEIWHEFEEPGCALAYDPSGADRGNALKLEKELRGLYARIAAVLDIHKGSLSKTGDDTLANAKNIQAELLLIWGRQDPHVPREGRRKIYEAIADAGVNFTWHEFNGQHAFLRDEGHRYDAELALKSYGLALELFHRKLGEGDLPAKTGLGPAESKH